MPRQHADPHDKGPLDLSLQRGQVSAVEFPHASGADSAGGVHEFARAIAVLNCWICS